MFNKRRTFLPLLRAHHLLGGDNAGFEYITRIIKDLEVDPRVASVVDVGPKTADDMAAYPHYAVDAAKTVAIGEADRVLLICGTGMGVAIAADKVTGRAILSLDAQVLCLGVMVVGIELARRLMKEWLGYTFDPKSAFADKVGETNDYDLKN
ncbi:ribose 5-phosphate isomerase [Calycina marina]|uniref:Ribose 5-phosphate isomerase n=1 Tax=Calycina marina TaxID=1763456 RepID=A0A9P7ZAJ2_9HELO|nr:ribose 5-phosphate isomerase [Calycina marina]